VEHYNNAPQKLQDELFPVFAKLEETIAEEFKASCKTIIANNPSLHLYSLGLYYHSWNYMLPTYFSEEGLEQVAKSYAESSEADIELEKKSLRWSPCDSPHHGEDELEYMMPKTEALLQEFSSTIDLADPMYQQYQWPKAYQDDSELYYDFISELHNKYEEIVISAMNKIWENKHLHDFFVKDDCALTLNAGDSSYEDFLRHAKKLNSKKTTQKLTQEIQDWHEVSKELSKIRRDKQQQELANPPTTALTLADFQDVIDNFNPSFKEVDGGIFLDIEHDYPLFGSSEREASANRIPLMEALEASPHYKELHKLYGHYMGPAFKKDDLLPCLCRALVNKLGNALTEKYSNSAFSVYMCVDRNTLYYITFISYRNDGYQFFDVSDEYAQQEILARQVSEIHPFYSPKVTFEETPSIISSLQKIQSNEDNLFSNRVNALFIQLETAMNKELEASLLRLIEDTSQDEIYSLGLCYNPTSWEYLIPFSMTNTKLMTDAELESYRYHESASVSLKSQALKWDKHYLHTSIEDAHKTMMPETNAVLTQMHSILTFSDSELEAYAPTEDTEASFEELQQGIFSIIYELVINALNRVRRNQKINTYLTEKQSVLALISEQAPYDDFFMQIIKLNGAVIHKRVKEEASQGLIIDQELSEIKEDIEAETFAKSVFEKLSIKDFQDVMDNFNPSFVEQGEAILLYEIGELPPIVPAEIEEMINSIQLMDLLQDSPHFEAIQQLYSNGIGPALKPGDILHQLSEAIVDKLGNALLTSFRDKAFLIQMHSDRYTPYRITFITDRGDGYKFFETPEDVKIRGFTPEACKIERFSH